MESMNPNNDGAVSAYIHGSKISSAPADGAAGNKWLQYFGPPNGAVNSAPYDKYKYTTYDLPEAYKGKNLYLRDTIDGLITGDISQHTWYTSPSCLPYVYTDQIHLQWNVWQFNRTLAGQVPHEGISRLITSSKRSFKEHTVRYGLAFYLEHGFMSTAEGRQQYARNLQGIRQCVQETNNYDVLATLLHSPRYDREYQIKHGEYSRPVSEVLRREVSEWAVVQKSGYGLDWLIEEYKEHLMRNGGVVPSVFIIPPRMAMFMTMADPVKTQYITAGPSGQQTLKQGPSALTTFRGVSVFKTHAFDVYADDLPINLLSRDMQVGEYYIMNDTLNDHNGYLTRMRDTIIYDESIDDWKRIRLSDAISNCRRFNENGILANSPGDDMFKVEGVGVNVNVYGQIRSSALPKSALDALGSTTVLDITPAQKKAIREGMEIVNKWADLKTPPASIPATGVASSGDNNTEPVQYLQSKPPSAAVTGGAGCCNWYMLLAVAAAEISAGGDKPISNLVDAVKALYAVLKKRFKDSLILDASKCGSKFLLNFLPTNEHDHCTFFENCVGGHYQPLWVETAGGSSVITVTVDATVKVPWL
jgi:hypothetical protein